MIDGMYYVRQIGIDKWEIVWKATQCVVSVHDSLYDAMRRCERLNIEANDY